MANCPVCGSPEHPSWKAHVFVNTETKQTMANTLKPVVANKGSTYRYRDQEKRRVYQRDLMRRRRASG